MARTIMMVFTNPRSAEQEAEYNAWYNQVHLKELLDVPGVVAATRYRVAEGAGTTEPSHRYVALYEVEGEPAAVFGALATRTADMSMSPALDTEGAQVVFWEAIDGGSLSR
ncbi:DUF4286 family protein [Cryptosporangium aurantiacum]|uniref:EthD domain-containing protein n=1 Tax=Cryptosporangium aurantiacum TaxID=134849 RepID=A0A1M7TX02_9ACTN|nr:DUF4286 family protein [Cryptosporangium aurantiacum]SHN75225.1 hypothetical protein SAMN05443668_107247 [Cryptosporangium aurantiacum]